VTLFDPDVRPDRDARRSAEARDAGMALAETAWHATEVWKELVLNTIRSVAEDQAQLSSIDVIEALGSQAPPAGSRVMGPLMRRAATLGYITGPVATRRSDRVSHHSGLENIWRSNLRAES